MTLVHIDLRRPNADGDLVPVTGAVEFVPTRRRHVDTSVVLPVRFEVDLEGGQCSVHLAPSGPDWCWQIIERTWRGISRYVAVPDVVEVQYTDLADVDPATLEPDAPPVPDSIGIATLAAGTATISSRAIASADSMVFAMPVGTGTGTLSLGTITTTSAGTAGTAVIDSSDPTDTRAFQWWVINPVRP